MVPLDTAAVRFVQSWLGEPRRPGLLDLYQAVAHHRLDLWGDDPKTPKSVVLFREGDGQSEAFGAGEPEPAIGWLLQKAQRRIALLAPAEWAAVIERRVPAAERVEILILSAGAADLQPGSSAVVTRRLSAADERAFRPEAAGPWALFGWRSFRDLIEHGVGFGVPFAGGYAALAWVYSQAGRYDAIGVSTVPQFRRLGLGRAVASALARDIIQRRGRIPLWAAAPENQASRALARSLGFGYVGTETILRWQPEGKTLA